MSLDQNEFNVYPTAEGFRIRLDEKLLFSSGSDKIKREYAPFIYELGLRLGRLGANIQIEGHTDDKRTSASMTNWDLSVSRATNIARFFIEVSSLPMDKVAVLGLADVRPLVPNESQINRTKNRRVEISVNTANRELRKLPW